MSYKSSINTGLPNIPDPPDPAFFAEFTRVYNAIRNLTLALDSYTGALSASTSEMPQVGISSTLLVGNQSKIYVQFSEAATAGQCVNLWNSSGLKARLANASTAGKPVNGWVTSTVALNGWAEVRLLGLNGSFAGLTPGATYFASNTSGAISSTAGTVSQRLGFAISATQLFFNPQLI